MKKILSFLSYHNAVPLAAVVLTMGAGITFAASQGVLPLPSATSLPVAAFSAPEGVDAVALLAADLDAFDFHPTVTGVVETDALYTVSYSILTLAPEGSAWTTVSKTGEFSVAKDALGDGGLNAYVVGKLRDIENGERSYLARAQTAEKALADAHTARPANVFAALVGLALDQIFVPVVQKPAPEAQPQVTPPAQEAATAQASQATTTDSWSADVSAASEQVPGQNEASQDTVPAADIVPTAATSTPAADLPALAGESVSSTDENATTTPAIGPEDDAIDTHEETSASSTTQAGSPASQDGRNASTTPAE